MNAPTPAGYAPSLSQYTPAAGEKDAAEGRLLPRVRAQIRLRHYSFRTEESYVQWVRRFVLFHDKRHPRG